MHTEKCLLSHIITDLLAEKLLEMQIIFICASIQINTKLKKLKMDLI